MIDVCSPSAGVSFDEDLSMEALSARNDTRNEAARWAGDMPKGYRSGCSILHIKEDHKGNEALVLSQLR